MGLRVETMRARPKALDLDKLAMGDGAGAGGATVGTGASAGCRLLSLAGGHTSSFHSAACWFMNQTAHSTQAMSVRKNYKINPTKSNKHRGDPQGGLDILYACTTGKFLIFPLFYVFQVLNLLVYLLAWSEVYHSPPRV